jgi:hypothetical protein
MKGVGLVAAAVVVGLRCNAGFAQTERVLTFVNVNVVAMDREHVDPGRTVWCEAAGCRVKLFRA